MNLLPGSAAFDIPSESFWDCVRISDGTIPVSATAGDGGSFPYEEGAYVPKLSWRMPSPTERDVLLGGPVSGFSSCISRLKLPLSSLTSLADLGMPRVRTQAEADLKMTEDRYGIFAHSLVEELAAFTVAGEAIKVLGVSVKEPGQITVTVDPRKGRRIGVHLDSWDKLKLLERVNSRTRININLGCESRYFIFCNLSVLQMHELLGAPVGVSGTHIGREFFSQFTSYPLIRLEVPPRCAYAAATDFLIHDATTIENTVPDVSIALLGHFDRSFLKTYLV